MDVTLEHTAALRGPGLRAERAAVRGWAEQARALGSEHRGLVEVEPGTWVLARADGATEVWAREPSAAERRAALGVAAPTARGTARPRVERAKSAAEVRIEKLFGRNS
jgi:hypothetical protein